DQQAPAAPPADAAPEEPEPAAVLPPPPRDTAPRSTVAPPAFQTAAFPAPLTQPASPSTAPLPSGSYVDARSHRVPVLVATAVAGVSALTVAGLLIGEGMSAVLLLPLFVMLLAAFVVIFLGGRSTEVRLERGVLNIRLGDLRRTFDLSSDATVIEVRSEPTSSDWSMVFLRRGLGPLEIDRRVVDPVGFTHAVRHWRPDVVATPGEG
ncbi:MAG: hypothetical protein Q7T52_14990, partial [Nocardioides sp.]|nr:hypothetical protein [Nocardioides sp.]